MSSYDDAISLIDDEVHRDCEYYVYSQLRDSVDELEYENAKLRQFASGMYGMLKAIDKVFGNHDLCETTRPLIFEEEKSFKDVANELGIEVD